LELCLRPIILSIPIRAKNQVRCRAPFRPSAKRFIVFTIFLLEVSPLRFPSVSAESQYPTGLANTESFSGSSKCSTLLSPPPPYVSRPSCGLPTWPPTCPIFFVGYLNCVPDRAFSFRPHSKREDVPRADPTSHGFYLLQFFFARLLSPPSTQNSTFFAPTHLAKFCYKSCDGPPNTPSL